LKASAPDVKVTVNAGEFDEQQFLTALASGNPPDVVYMDRALVGTYAAKGAIQPLEDCIEGQKIDTAQYRPAAIRSVTFDDKVYGIPEFYVVQANLIDAASLQKAGVSPEEIQTQDWGKLATTADKLFEKKGNKIARIGYDPKLPDSFPQWAMANGAEIIGEDGAPHLDDPKAVEALEFTVDLVERQGGWNDFKAFRDSFDIFGEENPLTKGTIAAFPMENWYVNVLRDSIPAGLKLQSTPFTDRQGQAMSILGGSAWAIPKGAKNPAAACAWAKTMTSTETWLTAAKARMAAVEKDGSFFTGLFTANTAADEQIRSTYLKDVPDAGFATAIDNYYGTLEQARSLNPSPAGAEIDAAWKSGVARALEGTAPADALAQAQKEAQAAYDKVADRG
jgi:multiple sugar transport system substrate-binding protein